MAVNLCRWALNDLNKYKINGFVRYAHRMRGKPPTEARTLSQRLDELNQQDELYSVRIDIGFPSERYPLKKIVAERLDHVKKMRKDETLEKLSRNLKLSLDLDDVKKEWFKDRGPHHIRKIIEHYGIYEHLYDEGYFYPRVKLDVAFPFEDKLCPVYYGNIVKPNEAKIAPQVSYEAGADSIWTLMLINLDGNFTDCNKEYIHWCVTNIPGDDISKGNTVVEYLQPIPPKGTGFHRYVFILYNQKEKIDYDIQSVKQLDPLAKRTFKTREWYKKYQNNVTPAGISFFQSDWDTSLKDFFHHKLEMQEPVFEYDFPKPYVRRQEWFPLRQPFNLYMDRYRDPKQINKEYLMDKLKKVHPFMKPEPPLMYPNAQRFPDDMPSWIKLQEKKKRMNRGRTNEIA